MQKTGLICSLERRSRVVKGSCAYFLLLELFFFFFFGLFICLGYRIGGWRLRGTSKPWEWLNKTLPLLRVEVVNLCFTAEQ